MEQAIGVFDSGYGGLTILKEFVKRLPEYDFIYLGDSARSPYGARSYEAVYKYTLQAVEFLFGRGCPLVILACNTASAKALRTIQQNDLPLIAPDKRILGVIRPTVEMLEQLSTTRHVGIMGTTGTIKSESYVMELKKLFPDIKVSQQACPMWVPLVENNEIDNPACDYFVEKEIKNLLTKDPRIDTIILGCTHYPLLLNTIKKFLPADIKVLAQDIIVADSLKNYLARHKEIDKKCTKDSRLHFYTTDQTETFDSHGSQYFEKKIRSEKVSLG